MTNDAPKVSVILTSYNQSQYIERSISSILDQTYQNFELIISDDASTDDSVEIINSFSDERIRVNAEKVNTGTTITNLEKCMTLATGKYIAIGHSDDCWAKDKLKKQVELMESRQELGAVFTLVQLVDGKYNYLDDSHNPFLEFNGTQASILEQFFYNYNFLCHPSVMIVSDMFREIMKKLSGAYAYKQLGDFLLWITLVKQRPIYVLPEKLTYYRLHENSMSSNSGMRNHRCSKNEMYFILKHFFEGIPEEMFIEGFGKSFRKKGQLSREELLCEQAFLYLYENRRIDDMAFVSHQIGIEKLYDLLNDEHLRKVLKESYGFDNKAFHALKEDLSAFKDNGHYDYYFEKLAENEILRGGAIAIYGSGRLAEDMFAHISRHDIVCFIENNADKIGGMLCGLPIFSIADAVKRHNVKAVIIASYQYQSVIYDRIKRQVGDTVEIVRVFGK